jgi:ubiquinone/menaquinone biosynthesis C-methylase UbiE
MTACSEVPKQPQGIGACQPSRWTGQFMRPSGWAGKFFGYVMASKNAAMNRLAVVLLDVKPDDQILEVGFGPGLAIEWTAARAVQGFVAGVDLSDVMVAQAAARNKQAIQAGRVELKQGTVLNLPYPNARFNKVFAVNNFHIWPDQERALREIHRVLKEGGLLLLPLRMKHPSRIFMMPPGFTEQEIGKVQQLLTRVGFRNIGTERHDVDQGIACVTAYR